MFVASIWEQLIGVDKMLFKLINQDSSSAFFDAVLPFLREAPFWLPFYIFLIIFATINFGKTGWWWALALILTAALCDIVSSQIIKENIFRLRPCRDPALAHEIIIRVKYCPKSSSFTSSHATSHFGLSMFIFHTFKKLSRKWAFVFFWAFAICFTQVYVGVHYPADMIAGGLIGCGIGYMMAYLFRKQIGLIIFENQPAVQ